MFLNAFRMLGLYWASMAFLGGISLIINHSSRSQAGCNFTLPGCGRFLKMAVTLYHSLCQILPRKRQHLFPQLLLLALSCSCFGQWEVAANTTKWHFQTLASRILPFSLTLAMPCPAMLTSPSWPVGSWKTMWKRGEASQLRLSYIGQSPLPT